MGPVAIHPLIRHDEHVAMREEPEREDAVRNSRRLEEFHAGRKLT
jgi:hypothetical protein